MERAARFNWRAFVVLGLVFSGLGLPISGLANHVHQFDAMNAARHAWMAAHNSLGAMFVVFCVGHVVLNRRALAGHLRGLRARMSACSREMLTAAAVVAFVLVVFVGHAFAVPGPPWEKHGMHRAAEPEQAGPGQRLGDTSQQMRDSPDVSGKAAFEVEAVGVLGGAFRFFPPRKSEILVVQCSRKFPRVFTEAIENVDQTTWR